MVRCSWYDHHCCVAAVSFQSWGYTLLLHVPPVASTDLSGYILNFAEQMSLILYSIAMPFTLLVLIGFVLTIIHQFLVQECIFAYFWQPPCLHACTQACGQRAVVCVSPQG